MTHLYIEQNTGLTEEVNSSIISKLYELAISGDLDETSDLKGRLHTTVAKDVHISYLNETFEDLYISADDLYITFADPEVERVLSTFWGNGTGVTAAQISAKTELNFSGSDPITGRKPFISNTTVRTFPELGNFTTIKSIGGQVFENASNLESIDLSNIQYIGWQSFYDTKLTGILNLPSIINLGNTGNQQGGSFKYCTHITSVVFGPNTTIIGNEAFSGCTGIQTVTGLSNSNLSTLGSSAFNGCTALTSVDIDYSNITTIPIDAFRGCTNLTNIGTNFSSVSVISGGAFNGCTSLTSIDLSNATNIYQEAFKNSGLTGTLNLTSLSSTQPYPFHSCNSVTRMDFSSSINADMSGIDTGLCGYMTGLQTVTGLSHVTKIVSALFANDTSLSSIDIDWSKITHIYGAAFQGTSSLAISNLSIPNLIDLRNNTFKQSGLVSISDLGSIQNISGGTFYGCANLVSVVLPNTVTYMSYDAFRECPNLQHVNIPSSCTDIGLNCFSQCNKLDETYDLSNLTIVRSGIFNGCTKVKVSNFPRVSSYANSAFYGIGNTTITIPKEVTSIGGACFRNLPYLQSVSFEANSQLTTIEYDGFMNCPNLQSIVLPEGITTIGGNCFNTCSSLYYIDFPSTLTTLNNGQTIGNVNDQSDGAIVVFRGTTPPTSNANDWGLFGQRLLQSISIYVPDASVQTYKSNTAFSRYADRIFGISQLPNS